MIPKELRPRRIVVLRRRGLGDIVLSSAVIDALARAYPDASLEYMAENPARELLESDDRLARIFLLRAPESDDGRVRTGSNLSAISWLRSEPIDLLLDLFSNPNTAILTACSGARYRVGLDKRLRRFAYNVRVPRFRGSPEEDHRYAGDVQLDMLRAAGIEWPGRARPGVAFGTEESDFALRSLAELGYVEGASFGTLMPGGSWESKRWSVEGFVEAGQELARQLGEPALVVWGPPERSDAEKIAAGLGGAGRLAPPSKLREMAALLGRSAVTVSTDCLGRHLAIVQGVPTVGVFGTTDPRDWTPREGPHRTVAARAGESLRSLSAEDVLREIRELVSDARLDSSRSRT